MNHVLKILVQILNNRVVKEYPLVQAVVDNGENVNKKKISGRAGFPCDCRSQLTLQCIHETAKKIEIIKIIGGHENHY